MGVSKVGNLPFLISKRTLQYPPSFSLQLLFKNRVASRMPLAAPVNKDLCRSPKTNVKVPLVEIAKIPYVAIISIVFTPYGLPSRIFKGL